MKKLNVVVLTLVITGLLIVSTFGGTAVDINTSSNFLDSLVVTKEVWDKDSEKWTSWIKAELGENVTFRITVTYYNVTQPGKHYAENIIVTDRLPDILPNCLEYIPGTAQPFEPVISSITTLVWDFGDTQLNDSESLIITFNASVSKNCCCCFKSYENKVMVVADEYCTGETYTRYASAWVYVSCPELGIDVEKKVWDPEANDGEGEWSEGVYAKPNTEVRFRVTVLNNGECNLTDIYVNDTLPDGLEYANDASPDEPDVIDDGFLSWFFPGELEPDDEIIIEFNATVVDNTPGRHMVNWVEVTASSIICCCPEDVSDQDSAKVKVNGMVIEKEVRKKGDIAWVEEVEASIGTIVEFRIIIYYYGDHTLYNIIVVDVLPTCLEYADNAVPKEPTISGNTLTWVLTGVVLGDGGSYIVSFEALVTGDSRGDCENWAFVTADECSGDVLEESDHATVDVVCELTADMDGPYSGEIDEDIEITGSATGGTPPYLYEWDLDDDGIYGELEDETGEVTKFSWDEEGNYEIHLRVTDDEDNTAYDTAAVIISPAENNPPNKPSKPSGPTGGKAGKEYTYYSTATDPDGDQIYYKFDWGDGSYTDTELYDSGAEGNALHVWGKGSWAIKVKAIDEHGAGSEWSDPLVVSMPKNKQLIELESGIYIDNFKERSFPITIFVGDTDIEIDAEGASRVEFYIDDELKAIDDDTTDNTYVWTWDEFSFGRHTLTVIAYDNAGNSATDEMTVWKFF